MNILIRALRRCLSKRPSMTLADFQGAHKDAHYLEIAEDYYRHYLQECQWFYVKFVWRGLRYGSRELLEAAKDLVWPCTPLHEAACRADVAAVRQLLAGGAKATARNKHGYTPLHYAVSAWGDGDDYRLEGMEPGSYISLSAEAIQATCQALIDAGAKIDARTKDGERPLHLAGYFDNLPGALALIRAGAIIDEVDKWGQANRVREALLVALRERQAQSREQRLDATLPPVREAATTPARARL